MRKLKTRKLVSISRWAKISFSTCFLLVVSALAGILPHGMNVPVGACEKDTADAIATIEIMEFADVLGVASPFHEWLEGWGLGDTLLPLHDTAREYMTGDTVLTCPDCWTLQVWDTLYPHNVSWPSAERWCVLRSGGVTWMVQPKTISIDTTWHPKVQVWLTPEEMRTLMALLHPSPFSMGLVIPVNVLDDVSHGISAEELDSISGSAGIWIKDSTVDMLE